LKEYLEGCSPASQSRAHFSLKRSDWVAGATAVALTSLANKLPARPQMVANLVAAGAISGLAARRGVGIEKQGLELRQAPRGVLYGLGAFAAIAVTISAGAHIKGLRVFYQDVRFTSAPPSRAAYEALVRIPIGTALPEEVIFRGAVLGILLRYQRPFLAGAISSSLFGLWHIVPAMKTISTPPAAGATWRERKVPWVAATVGTTSVAGFLLTLLRFRSSSIVAPWLAHSAANSAGYLATWFAARRAQQADTNRA
jgi:uncharacterized protein